MREKKMGMRAALTRLLGIATVACVLVATPAVASAETQVPANTQVLSLGQAGKEPVKITEPGCYVLRTSEKQTTPSSGYVIDVPNATSYNPVTIYIDGTVYVNGSTNSLVGQTRWLFNIKRGSNIEFIGINNPCVSFHDKNGGNQSVSGFLTDRYYDGGYKNASGGISVSLKLGDGSQNFFLSYSSGLAQKVPAISLGSTEGELTAKFEKLKIQDYVGKSGAVAGNAQEYAVPVHLFREGRSTTGGNTNSFTATFADCVFYDTSGDFNGAVSVDGNSSFKMPKDGSAVAKLTATFNNCSFSGHNGGGNGENLGVRQTNKSYSSVEASRYFANSSILNTYAVAGVMGVTNATVNLNDCTMSNFHSTRSSSADNTLTVDALNVARSARCNINGGDISRYGARGNTCVVYAAGTLTLSGSPTIASFWKNSHAGDTTTGDGYTEADIATGTAKSLYIPKKKSSDATAPVLNLASGLSVRGGDDHVWISIEETADSNGVKSRVLGTCESNKIEGVVPDGSSKNDDNSDKYEIVNLNGDLTFRETIHQHKWKVEADGIGVRASCVGPFRNSECEYGKDENGEPKKYLRATYKLSMSKATSSQSTALVYDGCPVKIALNKDGAWNLEQMGVTASDEFTWYQCKSQADAEAYKNGTKLKGAPTDAGYYYVITSFKTASGQTLEGKKSFEISQRRLVKNQFYKFTLKDGGKGAGKYAYDGKEHQPVVESAKFKNGAGEWVDLVEGKDYELSARSESGLKQTEPGQYECIVIGKGNFTTDGGTTSVLTLKWEIVDVSRFDLEVAGFDGTYDGDEHGITVNVKNDPKPADMKIEYREDGGDWTTDKPTYRNAAEYTTYYRVTASDYLTVKDSATVKISKAGQDAPTGLVGNNWTTCSSKDGSISGVTKKMEYRHELSKEYQKITSNDKLTGLAKSGTYYVRFAEDSNHNASADAEVKIEPGPHAVADNAAWQPGDGSHYKACKYCDRAQVWQSCRWNYKIITPATPEADGVRQKVCRVCNGRWDEERYTYVDTYAPTIYDLWVDKAYCESVSFDVFDDRDETVTVTDSGKELKAGKDGKYTVKAVEGDTGAEHVIVATDTAGNKETITIKMYAEHAYEWTIDKQPTVSEAGSKHGKCSVCGHESGAVEVPALAVKGYSGKYDGKDHSVDASALPEGSVVEYKAAGGGWTSVAPSIKDAGSVTVDYRVTIDDAAVDGKVTLEVKPRAITVAAQDASKTYGENDPKFTYDVTSGELVEGESLQGIEIERDDDDSVRDGGYALRLTQPEGANSNYKITFKDGTFTIGKRELSVTWDTTTEFTYDGEEHCPQAKLHNVIEGDDVSAYVDGAKVKAGTYTAKITELTGDDAGNYKLPAEGLTCEFSIKKAPQGAPKVQATAETVSGKSDGKITGVDAKMEWRAKGSGEYQGVPDGVTEIMDCAVGTYEVRYRADGDHDASSATEVTVNAGGKLVVTLPSKQVGYTIAASPDELDWHGSTTLTVGIESGYFTDNDSYAVKVNNAVVTPDARGEFTVQNAESDLVVTVEGVRRHEAVNDEWLSNDSTHWHQCACGDKIDESAHTFEWVVDKAPTATEKGSKQQKCKVCGHKLAEVEIPAAAIVGYSDEYDGDYHTVDATSLPEGATAKYSTDGKNWSPEAPKIKDVGTLTVAYQVTIDGATAEGEVTLEVKPRAITVAADASSKTYGEADPVFTWDVTSGELVEGESLQGLEIEREDDDSVRDGGYALHLTQAKDANPNYNITFVDGVFTINQRVLTVKWGTSEFVYDGKEHCPEATLGNLIGKDDLGATVEGSQVEAGDSYQANLTALTGKAADNYALPTEGLTCEFSIKNAAQDAPVVQATAETVSGKRDGKVTGVDATMEWRAKDAVEYQAVGEGTAELTGLAAGTYEVRYQAKANYDASFATEVTVAAGPKLVVTLPSNQVGYALTSTTTELDWHGTATLTMSIDSAYFAGKNYAVKVDGKAVELSDAGTFELKDVEGDVNVTVEGVLKHEPDGSGWANDAKNHWHVCRCGEVIDKAGHTFEWVVDKPATVEAKGEKHQECKVCGEKGKSEEIAILTPEIIDGKGQMMVVDAAKDLSFRSSAPIEFFQKVLVDDKEVAAENYVLTEGSTIVTLKASFLKTLGVGEHKLSVVSATGTAETTFTVAEAAKPAPGQTTTTTTTTTTTSKPKKKAGKETLPESGDSEYVMAGAVLAAGMAALLLAWAMKRRA